jgi:cell division protein FtsQ
MRSLKKTKAFKTNYSFILGKFISAQTRWSKGFRWGIISALVILIGNIFFDLGEFKKRADSSVNEWGGFLSNVTGLIVSEVLVNGREQTKKKNLLRAAQIMVGDPILGLQLQKIQTNIAELPWVKTVSVERQFPDTIVINLIERKPTAIWQKNGGLNLIDSDGVVILTDALDLFSYLPIVIGRNAPENASKIISVLAKQPMLYERVKAITFVTERRWDVRLDNKIDIKLPEKQVQQAWSYLAEIERGHKVLHKDVVAVDMRIPDQLIIRLTPNKAMVVRKLGRST